jgi:hypothetical protein
MIFLWVVLTELFSFALFVFIHRIGGIIQIGLLLIYIYIRPFAVCLAGASKRTDSQFETKTFGSSPPNRQPPRIILILTLYFAYQMPCLSIPKVC